jgi:hypothetical protein
MDAIVDLIDRVIMDHTTKKRLRTSALVRLTKKILFVISFFSKTVKNGRIKWQERCGLDGVHG